MEVQQLELDLWQSLETASRFPETADLRSLCDALEQTLSDRSLAEQLSVAGDVLVQLSEVCAARSQLMISTWEHRYTPSEPVVNLANCVDLFVQSLSLDVAELFEEAESVQYPANRKQNSQLDPNDSVIGEVGKTTLLSLVDELSKEQALNEMELAEQIKTLAHRENVEEWSRAIANYLHYTKSPIQLLELQQALKMPMVEVWLGLLLGNFSLRQQGDFYSTQNVWVGDNCGMIEQ
jgi:hypothetical protein